MSVYVLPRWAKADPELPVIDVTSGGNGKWASPFTLGPVMLYGGNWSRNMENGWQYAKVYPEHFDGPMVSDRYFTWAQTGWASTYAHRYPMGKGAKPAFALWAGQELGYIEARKRIYMPLYSTAVRMYQLNQLCRLMQTHDAFGNIVLKDYDAYDHRALGYSWDDVISDPAKKMGHAFVLAMMLEGVL